MFRLPESPHHALLLSFFPLFVPIRSLRASAERCGEYSVLRFNSSIRRFSVEYGSFSTVLTHAPHAQHQRQRPLDKLEYEDITNTSRCGGEHWLMPSVASWNGEHLDDAPMRPIKSPTQGFLRSRILEYCTVLYSTGLIMHRDNAVSHRHPWITGIKAVVRDHIPSFLDTYPWQFLASAGYAACSSTSMILIASISYLSRVNFSTSNKGQA